MKKLRPVERAVGGADFIAISEVKEKPHGPRLLAHRQTILALITDYLNKTPNLSGLLARKIGLRLRKSLLHTYNSSTLPLDALRNEIFSKTHAIARACQYCAGLNPEPTTLDHYLEKSLYPEFAVFYRNLVPCCPECNRRRKRTFQAGARAVIHFYDDAVDQIPVVLRAEVTRPSRARFFCDFIGPPEADVQLFVRHFSSLHLEQRLGDASAEHLTDMLDQVVDAQNPRRDGAHFNRVQAIEQLSRTARTLRRRYGNNAFRAALADGCAHSDLFLDECERVWATQ